MAHNIVCVNESLVVGWPVRILEVGTTASPPFRLPEGDALRPGLRMTCPPTTSDAGPAFVFRQNLPSRQSLG
jgi:hypothetical protein